MLKYRVLTACILLPIAILAIFMLPTQFFKFFVLLFVIIGGWEWAGLIDLVRPITKALYVIVILLLTWAATKLELPFLLLLGALTWVWLVAAVVHYNRGGQPLGIQIRVVRVVLGVLLVIPCYYAILYLRNNPNLGSMWLLWLLSITWATDVGAFFIGRKWGKRPLAPKVSPKKTREGLIGGVILAFLVALLGVFFVPINGWQRGLILILWLITIIFSVFGDLAISLVKRLVGVKDTGQLLPGHGGVLDRVDSLLATSVIFSFGVCLLFFFNLI